MLERAQVALHGAMTAHLEPHGLSVPQYACLELLARRRGASAAGGARSAARPLTDEGARRLRDAARAVAEVEDRMMAGLSPTARAALLRALRACEEALRAGGDRRRGAPGAQLQHPPGGAGQ